MKSVYIYPWHPKSGSAKQLSVELGIKRLRKKIDGSLSGSDFIARPNKTVINWGSSETLKELDGCRFLNKSEVVNKCANKLTFFRTMKDAKSGPKIPRFTTDVEEAFGWIKEKSLVVARTQLRSRSGNGIVFFNQMKDFVKAPLYVEYIKKKEEYRVHIAFDEIICVQQKVLRKTDDLGEPVDPKNIDFRVRSHKNGFIFAKNGLHTPPDVLVQATKAMKSSGLDFGAVDIIYNQSMDKAFVLEINTAPGLEGSTVDDYVRAFRTVLE